MIDWLAGFPVLIAEAAQPRGNPLLEMMFPLVAIGFLFYFLLIRPQRREQARKEEMLQALKKNDRVITIGGIIGSVANLSSDGREVTIKVDDNTRIKMLRSSVQSVVRDEDGEE